jgi:hypothetical protein
MPMVEVRFGQRIQPPATEMSDGGAITFQASGDMDDPTLLAQVTYGGKNFELALKRDPDQHQEIVGRFDTEMARFEALRKPIVDLLKNYAVLEGTSVSDNPSYHPKGYSHRLVLVRNAENGTYSGEATFTVIDTGAQSPFPSISAEVTLVEDQPMLLIQTPIRQYQLNASDAGKLTGGWFHAGFPNGYPIELTVTSATDAPTR